MEKNWRDELVFGVFNATRDIIEINGVRKNVDHLHGSALWMAVLEAVHRSEDIVTHPSIATVSQLMEIIVSFEIEVQADVLIHHINVGNHPLCTAP